MIAHALRKAGWITFVEHCDVNHVLPVQGRTYAHYLTDRPGSLRSTLRRKAGKLAVTIDKTFVPAAWAAYEAIYAQSWKGAEGSPDFLCCFAQREGAAGRLRLGIARVDGHPVAAQFWTIEAGTAFIHKLAHAEAARDLSPGTALTAALLEYVIDQDRVDLVDFGTGDDRYKRDWMEAVRPRYRIEAFRAERPGTWPLIARKMARRVAAGLSHG
ncbi:MAG: GNAT family N-acetyltransferase [Novosphingobium sp.]